ncbi:protein [Escherichia coli]|uniref:Protein n=1 Tax=Escherichia coli TaxID=562 RepID=A0A376KS35_ECOLX|nr:protein [Escherichia coli]
MQLPGISLSAAVALLERRSQAIHAPALDRGAAHGALMRLEHPNASAEAALTMLAQLSPAQSGEALHGLLALGPPSTGLSADIYRRFQQSFKSTK